MKRQCSQSWGNLHHRRKETNMWLKTSGLDWWKESRKHYWEKGVKLDIKGPPNKPWYARKSKPLYCADSRWLYVDNWGAWCKTDVGQVITNLEKAKKVNALLKLCVRTAFIDYIKWLDVHCFCAKNIYIFSKFNGGSIISEFLVCVCTLFVPNR